jgi:hypothetical protein
MPIAPVRKSNLLLFYLFLGISLFLLVLKLIFPGLTIDWSVLQGANLLLFLVGFISSILSSRALAHKSVQGFLRLVYGSFLLKFFILAIAAFIYIYINKKNVNKPALLGCAVLYVFYTFIEVQSVLKMSKKPNA